MTKWQLYIIGSFAGLAALVFIGAGLLYFGVIGPKSAPNSMTDTGVLESEEKPVESVEAIGSDAESSDSTPSREADYATQTFRSDSFGLTFDYPDSMTAFTEGAPESKSFLYAAEDKIFYAKSKNSITYGMPTQEIYLVHADTDYSLQEFIEVTREIDLRGESRVDSEEYIKVDGRDAVLRISELGVLSFVEIYVKTSDSTVEVVRILNFDTSKTNNAVSSILETLALVI